MDFIKELFEDVDTPIFNQMKKQYHNPMLEFIEETDESPLFNELRGRYSEPMTASEKPADDLIEIPVVQYQAETVDIADSEIAYLLSENRRLQQEKNDLQMGLYELEDLVGRQKAEIALLKIEKDELIDAIIKTVSYAGNELLPPIDGWSWYDALKKFQPESAENYAKVYAETGGIKERTPLQQHVDEMTETQLHFKDEYLRFLTRDPGFVSTFGDKYDVGMDDLVITQEEGAGERSPEDPYTITISQQIHFIPETRAQNDAYSDTSHSMKGES